MWFACIKTIIKNGSIINIKGSNIAYVSPHIITIKKNNYLLFNGSDTIFVNDYSKSIKLKDLEFIFYYSMEKDKVVEYSLDATCDKIKRKLKK